MNGVKLYVNHDVPEAIAILESMRREGIDFEELDTNAPGPCMLSYEGNLWWGVDEVRRISERIIKRHKSLAIN